MGKRHKLGKKPHEYKPDEIDYELMSDFEREVTKGRYILEKKTKFTL